MQSCTAYLYAYEVIFATCDEIPNEAVRQVWEGLVADAYGLPSWIEMRWFRRDCPFPGEHPSAGRGVLVRSMIFATLN